MSAKPHRSRRRNRRSGFTLLEILLVAAILVIMASMATFAYNSLATKGTSNLARSEINTMQQACNMYFSNHLRYPNSLQELYTSPNGMSEQKWGGPYLQDGDARDPWDREYKYEIRGESVVITSLGPDGVPGSDDVTNDPAANSNK